jgi:serine/threonine-protein kinase HipA
MEKEKRTVAEIRYGVWLGNRQAGILDQRGDYTVFSLIEDYILDPERSVLGLQFEQDLTARHSAALRLPPWFSNLLPGGIRRQWIADERGVSVEREMELLAQVGHDLPGAVQVLAEGESPSEVIWDPSAPIGYADELETVPEWRFSLAGVALKFSMITLNDRLSLPAFGQLGDTIVKLPDRTYPEVPRNEYIMMSLARACGIDVPEVKLIHRDELGDLPDIAWPGHEEWAYAVRRFDRDEARRPIHIEDMAQVRNFYPGRKYAGNLETVASLIHRGQDVEALREFARRLAFIVLIANGDAHLKNWSLIYRNPRVPTLSPAYDLVSTAWYNPDGREEHLGLRFYGSRRFENVNLVGFRRLERILNSADAGLPDVVGDLVARVKANWPSFANGLDKVPEIREGVSANIEMRARSLLSDAE